MPRTTPLWRDEPTRFSHEASVLESTTRDGRTWLLLTESIAYPGGGGQPRDEGTIGGQPILDVTEERGDPWYAVAVPPTTTAVEVVIDGALRLQGMQQHTGQHLLSAAAFREFGAQTVGFHIGSEDCTVDLARPPLSPDELERLETAVGDLLRENPQVRSHALTREQAAARGDLRKEPTVDGDDIRVVEIVGLDAVPCCGTHLPSVGGAAPILVLRQEKMRGNARLHFLCGGRAEAAARRIRDAQARCATLLNVPGEKVADRAEELLAEVVGLRRQVRELRLARLADEGERRLAAQGPDPSGRSLLVWRVDGADPGDAGDLAGLLTAAPGRVVALGFPGDDKATLVLARSEGMDVPCGEILRATVTAHGGRGGGAPGRAQGSVPAEALDAALGEAAEALGAQRGDSTRTSS